MCSRLWLIRSFNTQPPEGGWAHGGISAIDNGSFNTQPPEGGWFRVKTFIALDFVVSTHSRPKAAGYEIPVEPEPVPVSTHSRPKAAGG